MENKLVNGKQCMIVWYVDDNKVSHVERKVIDELLSKIKSFFGDITVTRGKEHIFGEWT